MILFTERQALLLQFLSEVDHATTGSDLAAVLGVSTRTLRYDISRINGITKTDIVEATPKGYRLNQTLYNDFLARNSRLGTQLDHHERILLYLLKFPRTDVYDVMRDCYLSESVTRAALQRLRSQLAAYKLTLELRGSSVHLSGDEICFRRLLGELVHNAMDVVIGQKEKVSRYLPDVSLSTVGDLLRELVYERQLQIDDIRLDNTVINLAICLQRSQFPLPSTNVPHAVPSRSIDELAKELLRELKRLYPSHRLARTDREYVQTLVGAAFDQHTAHVDLDSEPAPLSIDDTIRTCLDESIKHFDLKVDEEKLYRSVSEHVERLISRTRVLPYFRNTLQESLRSRSPFLYDVAVYLADRLTKTLGISFPDDEIGLLAIYLGLYSRPVTAEDHAISSIVVCPRYQTLRDWLLTGLVEHFGQRLQIIGIVSSTEEADEQDCDLVISTTDSASRAHPCVQISALLSDLDYSAVDSAISRATKLKSRSRFARAIRRFLDPGLFFTDVSPKNANDAIVFLCDALHKRGFVPPEFQDSVLLRETYSPTAFARRFAVPHAMDFLAYETKVAILIPATSIDWETADVSLVLMLAINGDDYDDFTRFYQPLISLLYDPQLYSGIRKVANFDELLEFLGTRLSETE